MDNRLLREWVTTLIHIYHGPRRAGKTQKMTHDIACALIACVWINKLYEHLLGSPQFLQPLKVWSTYPVEFLYRPSSDGATWAGADEPLSLKTFDLDFHKLIAFDPEISWGFIFIDELDQKADRQEWQNGGQPLLMRRLTQVGKSHLSLVATIQSLQWVNPRYMFQVDMTTGCRDAARTGWGKANGLIPGDLTFLYSKDLSGAETGSMYEESGIIYQSQFYGKPIQPFFLTDKIHDPWQRYESIKIARTQYVLDPHAKEEMDEYTDNIPILEDTLIGFIEEGNLKPKRADFFRAAENKGLVMDKSEAVQYICDCHNVKVYGSMGDNRLDLSQFKNLQAKIPKEKVVRRHRIKKVGA
jgi:hypothetical protein